MLLRRRSMLMQSSPESVSFTASNSALAKSVAASGIGELGAGEPRERTDDRCVAATRSNAAALVLIKA